MALTDAEKTELKNDILNAIKAPLTFPLIPNILFYCVQTVFTNR